MNLLARPAAIIALVACAALAAVLLVTPPPPAGRDAAPPEAAVVQDARAGVWYCPADDVSADETMVVAVRPGVDDRPAQFTTRDLGSDGVTQFGEIFPGAGKIVEGAASDDLEVRWDERPVSVSRLTVHRDDPVGLLARPCVPRVATSWVIPGMTTAAGATATLRLTNPLAQDAFVAIEGMTPQGLQSPLALQNRAIPPGETVTIDLNEFLPQQPDLGVRITATSGRIAVDAELASVPTISGVAGRSSLVAQHSPGVRWFLPWVATSGRSDGRGSGPGGGDPTDAATEQPTGAATEQPTGAATEQPTDAATEQPTGAATDAPSPAPSPTAAASPAPAATPTEEPTAPDDILDVVVEGDAEASSWLWLANPNGDEAASVAVSFMTANGRVPSELLGSIEVSPGSVRRVVLDEVLPEQAGDIGVEVQSTNDVPITVSGGVIVDDGEDAARTGIGVLTAIAFDDQEISLTTVSQRDREQWLTLANPFGVPAVVNLSLWNGSTTQAPSELQAIGLGPGETRSVQLTDWATGQRELTVFAQATTGSVTAMLRGLAPDDHLRFSATTGVPLRIWTADGSLVGVANEPGQVNRLGTPLGLPVPSATPTDPFDDPSDVATPTSPTSPSPTGPSPAPAPTPAPTSDPSTTADPTG